jgi:hypothetical protein
MNILLERFPEGLTGKGWDFKLLSANSSLPLQWIDEHSDLDWAWYDLIHHPDANHDFILRHKDKFLSQYVDVNYALSCRPDLPQSIIQEFENELDIMALSCSVNPEFVNLDKICWYNASKNRQLTREFISTYRANLYWNHVSSHSMFTLPSSDHHSIIDEFLNVIDWNVLSATIQLDAETLVRYVDRWIPNSIIINKSLSVELFKLYRSRIELPIPDIIHNCYSHMDVELTREFYEMIDWNRWSQYVLLSTQLIEEFKDKLNWSYIAINESITDSIITEYSDMIPFDMLVYNSSLTSTIMKEFFNRFNLFHLSSHPNLTMDVVDYIESTQSMEDQMIMTESEDSENSDDMNNGYWRWSELSRTLQFSEVQVHRYRHDIDWYNLSRNSRVDVAAIIKNPWLPWDVEGLSRRSYDSIDDEWLRQLAQVIEGESQLMELRPVIYEWELTHHNGRFKLDCNSIKISEITQLIRECYPIKVTRQILQDLIFQSNHEDAILVTYHIRTPKLIKLKKNTPDSVIEALEINRIPYSMGWNCSHPTLESIMNIKLDKIEFVNVNNSNELLRNYLDWRGVGYKMIVQGCQPLRPSYIQNSKVVIRFDYVSKSKSKIERYLQNLKGHVRNIKSVIDYDLNGEYYTQESFKPSWSRVDISRIGNYKALEYSASIGLNVDLLNPTIEKLKCAKSSYTLTKIAGSCCRLAWYCEEFNLQHIHYLISLLSNNQELNSYVMNVILILALRKKIMLADYSSCHPFINHLVKVKA